jgi:hypothetical protein
LVSIALVINGANTEIDNRHFHISAARKDLKYEPESRFQEG